MSIVYNIMQSPTVSCKYNHKGHAKLPYRQQEEKAWQKRTEKRDFKERTWADYAKQTQNSLTGSKREEARKERRTLERNPPTHSYCALRGRPPRDVKYGGSRPGDKGPAVVPWQGEKK